MQRLKIMVGTFREHILLALLVLLVLGGCSATPVDVLKEADGVQRADGSTDKASAVVERATAAVDIYYVFGRQAERVLMNDLTPQPVGRAIIIADDKISNVVLRLHPLVKEMNAMVLATGVEAEGSQRYRYLMCNVPRLTDSVSQGLPELKSALMKAGEGKEVIPQMVLTTAGALLGGYCAGMENGV